MSAPTGILSEPISTVRGMVAASPTFRDWIDAPDAPEAAKSVYLVTSTRNPKPRFALIDFGQFIRDRHVNTAARPFIQRDGSTIIVYVRASVEDDQDEDALIDFCNAAGGIWTDLEMAAGVYAQRTLAIRSIELIAPPARIVPEKRDRAGDYYEAALSLTYTRQP
jgi:hypothetical protein